MSEDNDEYNERKIFSDIWYSDDGWLRLKDIMKQMIEPDPIKRIKYDDILKELNYSDS